MYIPTKPQCYISLVKGKARNASVNQHSPPFVKWRDGTIFPCSSCGTTLKASQSASVLGRPSPAWLQVTLGEKGANTALSQTFHLITHVCFWHRTWLAWDIPRWPSKPLSSYLCNHPPLSSLLYVPTHGRTTQC